MNLTRNRILDLAPGVGQAEMTWRFELLSGDDSPIGALHPYRGASMSMNTGAQIMRTVRGFKLPADEAKDVNVYADRVKVYCVLEDGSEWPQGVFVFSDPVREFGTWHTPMSANLVDLGFILGQSTDRSFGVNYRGLIYESIERLLARTPGINRWRITASPYRVGIDPILWKAGTPTNRIFSELSDLAGFHTPYFDNEGVLIFRPVEALADGDHVHDYRLERAGGSRVIRSSPVQAQAVDTPGAHLVISTGVTKGPITGIAYVHPDLPYSRERRGFLVVETHDEQGIESTQQARRMAESYVELTPEASARFSSPPDPRHDAFDTIRFGLDTGTLWRELEWSMQLTPGGTMTHTLARGGTQPPAVVDI